MRRRYATPMPSAEADHRVGILGADAAPDEPDRGGDSRVVRMRDVAATEVTASPIAGCADGTPVEGRPLRIATTVAPLTSIVANIAGGSGTVVTGLVPEGVNSHTYEPSPSVAADARGRRRRVPERARAGGADEGIGIGEHAATTPCCASSGTTVLPDGPVHLRLLVPEVGWRSEPASVDESADGGRVRDARPRRVGARSTLITPACTTPIWPRSQPRVDAFDRALRDATATVPPDQRLLLTYHDAYAYFAREYGWTVVGRDPAVVVRRADAARRRPADRPDRGAARAGRVRERGVPVAGAGTDRGRDRARATSTTYATTICRAIPATPSTRGWA